MDERAKQLIVRISLENLALRKENKVLEGKRTQYVNNPPKRHESQPSIFSGFQSCTGSFIVDTGILKSINVSNGIGTSASNIIITTQAQTLNGLSNSTPNC